MKLKEILTGAAIAASLTAAGLVLADMAVDAAVYEIDSAPRPTLDQLNYWCSQGEQGACEAYYDRVNAGEQK